MSRDLAHVKLKPKPDGIDKPYVKKIIKTMSKVNVAVYRWTSGLLGSRCLPS